ncbi:MAG: hypothetical protein AAFR55_06210 [Pseudomonadota bacterium]
MAVTLGETDAIAEKIPAKKLFIVLSPLVRSLRVSSDTMKLAAIALRGKAIWPSGDER